MTDKKTETTTKTVTPAEEPAPDLPTPGETVPGGHYIDSEGVHRDAEGRELTKAGKLKHPPEE